MLRHPAHALVGGEPAHGRAPAPGDAFRVTEHQSEQRHDDCHDRNHADAGAEEADERVEDGGRRVARQNVLVDRVEVRGAADADERQQQQCGHDQAEADAQQPAPAGARPPHVTGQAQQREYR